MSVSINNLSFSYEQGEQVLKGINLDVYSGEFVAIMGLSGSGKTTLLRLLLGFHWAQAGEIKFSQKVLTKESLTKIRETVSYIPQSGALFPHLTAKENVFLPLKIKKPITKQDFDRLDYLANICGITSDILNKKPQQLSGGQRQRVAILRALMADKNTIFLDEPFSALDSITKMGIQKEFKEVFKKENKTILMVTHSLQEAMFMCDKVILLKDGKVDCINILERFVRNPETDYARIFVESQLGHQ